MVEKNALSPIRAKGPNRFGLSLTGSFVRQYTTRKGGLRTAREADSGVRDRDIRSTRNRIGFTLQQITGPGQAALRAAALRVAFGAALGTGRQLVQPREAHDLIGNQPGADPGSFDDTELLHGGRHPGCDPSHGLSEFGPVRKSLPQRHPFHVEKRAHVTKTPLDGIGFVLRLGQQQGGRDARGQALESE
ncbi:hypothetical protein QTI66_34170 [Variovorax sp. J22R133]|uniref:hypothetical protein n=1 Tax=Variovorax brevis TaxID=3053503 RepID=UPI0025753F3D|nr:hypothetical protein [Variovorax sp. J22R133]MDM0117173.1 hypothetical protein [Variovorax sp. J22R133]